MCSSATSPPSCLFLRTTSTRPLLGSRCLSPYSFFRSNNPRILRLSASVADCHLDLSWFSPGHSSNDDGYNGWAVVEAPPRSCFPTILLGGGTCVAALVAAIAYFSLSRKGFKLQFHSPFRALHGMMSPIDSKADKIEAKNLSIGDSDENAVVAEGSLGFMPEENGKTITSVSAQKLERVKVSVPVDSTQLEALSVLKKLKESKHRLVPSMLLSGSVVAAFDDVNVEDSDFDSIQGTNCGSDSSNGDLSFFFYPDRFISRQDLINWKAQLEYRFMPEMTEQMSRIKVDYMDVKEISSDASAELLIDLLAGDQSIIRKVFGQSRRVQPNKPLTKAQAAVALTSGRMTEAIYNEILRLEAENSSRQVAMKEIRSELLDKGDIERFWDEKMNEERARGLEIQKLYIAVLHDLEHEKTVQEKTLAEHLKEKAAMDCQRQLLLGLKDEVDEMSERLTSERSMYVAEQCKLQELLSELQTKQEGMLDKKSIAEAETEALRILRSWVEDEARKSQARAKVLEEVGRRWKWDNQA
ncbi:hypothetical protein GH714_041032 [Hevea brasiliensis]|uniref:SLH domain-containing protein n=1 Tax=Hevea brasiliensis TaxID=3981 RepID=A0A6A6NA52_HEVBR|nr:hypothetical protein GH714_041032 [Hevea brasiliensis]